MVRSEQVLMMLACMPAPWVLLLIQDLMLTGMCAYLTLAVWPVLDISHYQGVACTNT